MQSLTEVCPILFLLQHLQRNKNFHQDPFSKQTPPLTLHSCEVMKLTVPSIYLSQLILFLLYLYMNTLPIKRAYLPSVYITAPNQRFRCLQERSDKCPSVQAEVYLTLHMYDLDNYSCTITKQQLPQSNSIYVLK